LTKVDLEPSDSKMVDRWMMHTEFMLNRVKVNDLKKLIDDLRDAINYQLNEDGKLEKVDFTPIERRKDELNERAVEKVEDAKKPEQVIKSNLSRLKQDSNLPGMGDNRNSQIKILEETLEDIKDARSG